MPGRLDALASQRSRSAGSSQRYSRPGSAVINLRGSRPNSAAIAQEIEGFEDDFMILTHVREKLQFIEKENSALDSGLGQLEAGLADKRDRLGRAKVERDTLRLKGRKIKESGSNLTSPQLLDDIEIQKEKREGLMGSIEEAQRHYAELSDSIQRTNHRIMNATEELQAAQAAASIIAPGMAAAAAARSVSGAAIAGPGKVRSQETMGPSKLHGLRFLATPGRDATDQELLAVHDPQLVAAVTRASEALKRAACRAAAGAANGAAFGGMGVDLEALEATNSSHIQGCYVNASTAACARLAAGSAADVACRVLSGAARHGAAIIRPPGHHAESSVAMGFCYYNNAAVAARAAQAAGARRVVIMDWDVHHGNGTQRIFYDDPTVLYMSTHRHDRGRFFPGSGAATEAGSGAGLGFTINVAWNGSGVCDADMLAAFRHVILPVASEFRPDLVIVSAGFDAVEGDPLGGCCVSPAAFGHFTALLAALAPSVLLLEGGYNLTATAAATEACMRVLLGEAPTPLPVDGEQVGATTAWADPAPALAASGPWQASGLEGVSESALESLRAVLGVQGEHWEAARVHGGLVEAAVQERRQGAVAGAGAAPS
ncbi:Histone deacetylase 6, partial [Tetrabaena socialis]